jgi:ABC transport permease subunit
VNLVEKVDAVEAAALSFVREVGFIIIFTYESVKALFHKPFRYLEIIRHMEFIGNESVFIISLTGLFTGLALSFQIYLGFKLVNAVNLVGPTVALGITRELGPVLTGLIVAARAGGAMAARLGTMRVNEQIDALDVMGIDTKNYLISPRILAAVICMPLLTAVFDFVAMIGAWFLVVHMVELDEAKRTLYALTHVHDISLIREDDEVVKTGFRIEAYDVAHLSGKNTAGVMVVAYDTTMERSAYRKFKIQHEKGAHETASLSEILKRRFNHPEWPTPDLIVVDGNEVQRKAAQNLTDIPVVSVVKNERHKPKAILGDAGLIMKHQKTILLANSEAHRFSIAYHRLLRSRMV